MREPGLLHSLSLFSRPVPHTTCSEGSSSSDARTVMRLDGRLVLLLMLLLLCTDTSSLPTATTRPRSRGETLHDDMGSSRHGAHDREGLVSRDRERGRERENGRE